MSETTEVIAQRYACRAYSDQAVAPETLQAIAEAGLRSPSAMNRQPWQIILVSDRAVIAEIEAAGLAALKANDPTGYERIQGRGGKLLYNAPAMIVIAKQPMGGYVTSDLEVGIVAAQLSLAATSLGVDNVIVAMPAIAFQGDIGDHFKQLLGFPEGYEFGIGVLLGYAAGTANTQHPYDPAKLTVIG